MDIIRKLILVLLFLLPGVWGFADGCYFPERAVKTIPSIPTQRALLVWRDGVETLIVSSEIDSAAQQLGWIIPLPAVPTEMSKASPGLLKTLSFCCQPRITHDLSRPARYLAIAVGVELLLLFTWRFQRKRLGEVLVLLFVLCLLCLWVMLMPALGSAGSGRAVAGVVVEKSARVGEYQISVVRAKAAEALNQWLDENGCAELPPEAGPAVKAYLDKGWVFAAIRLVREDKGRNVPHPVRFRFASPEAVYPMRLTALAGGAPQIELFVIGDKRAHSPWLRTEFCDRYRQPKAAAPPSLPQDVRQHPMQFGGQGTGSRIAHAAVTDLLWDDAVVTKLSGKVSASQMTTDLPLRWEPFAVQQDHWYTREGAAWTTLIFALILIGIGALVGVPLSTLDSIRMIGGRVRAGQVLSPALGAIALASGLLYLALPKLPGADARTSKGRQLWWAQGETLHHVSITLDHEPDLCRLEPDAIGNVLVGRMAAIEHGNQIQGGPVVFEDSPGNITVRKDADGLIVTTYDRYGQAYAKGFVIPTGGPAVHAP